MTGTPSEAVAELARLGAATVYEAAGRKGMVDGEWIRVLPGTRVAGPAYTVLCADGDNRGIHEAIAKLSPGDVLVATSPNPTPFGLVGELLATQAAHAGAAGLVIDGGVRDTDDLRELGLPVWSRWVRMRGAAKDARGTVQVPVQVGGQTIHPGDVVIADADGVTVVPRERLEEVVDAALAREAKENGLRVRWEAGEFSYDAYGFRKEDEENATT
ncbi:4-carboxy-4-hydroxy-2-oxoadipate aldolase/oxaloacetate decarboxylase [Gryllotalpicola ginsengisoli]|uniref:4-carboxy-4-hydroxy-2-oxoadipate aldolase/oxaloacetate decarboxylase n=1 Tax=Gryllotalpicola ginsengisoli TaxID=444608 RepID=UPI000481C2E8|nr:4-carboxy-4-hydroxy-2-oxoadipate aldolase/oxaloacetate decarboxylase [Gryllotalpicola ginsengisoli]